MKKCVCSIVNIYSYNVYHLVGTHNVLMTRSTQRTGKFRKKIENVSSKNTSYSHCHNKHPYSMSPSYLFPDAELSPEGLRLIDYIQESIIDSLIYLFSRNYDYYNDVLCRIISVVVHLKYVATIWRLEYRKLPKQYPDLNWPSFLLTMFT